MALCSSDGKHFCCLGRLLLLHGYSMSFTGVAAPDGKKIWDDVSRSVIPKELADKLQAPSLADPTSAVIINGVRFGGGLAEANDDIITGITWLDIADWIEAHSEEI